MSDDRPNTDPEIDAEAFLKENAAAFAAHAEWLERNGHPLPDIMVGPGADTWRDKS